jgi:2-polyprenyl-3-methyl-5-hydroxy-6-metoxy-1,4-benzoquinol methylase
MDGSTISAYDHSSASYAKDWTEQPAPVDMYSLLERFFVNGPTIDVGCGGGRDAAWLQSKGFDVSGVDASEGLLREARKAYPHIWFYIATLPRLDELIPGVYQNVLCETVLMHLDSNDIPTALRSLLALLVPGGTLYLSWRVTPDASIRDDNGRLYSAFNKEIVLRELSHDAAIVFDQEDMSASSGKTIHRLIAKRR